MKTIDYWKAAKRALDLESDYAMAKHLDITRASASLLANGQRVMGNTTAAKIGEILGIDPLKVIADAEIERGSADDEFWKRVARRAAAVLLPAAIAGGLGSAPAPADASATSPAGSVYYVKLYQEFASAV